MNTHNAHNLIAVLLSFFLLTGIASAATITLYNGDVFDYDPNNTYLIEGALSSAVPTFTLGANMEPGEVFWYHVTAPLEFGIWGMITTGPNGTGEVILVPNSDTEVYAGTSFDFPLNGDLAIGQTKWLTLSVDGNPDAMAYFEEQGQYTLPVGEVPVPPAVWLLGSGLIGLVTVARRRTADEGRAFVKAFRSLQST